MQWPISAKMTNFPFCRRQKAWVWFPQVSESKVWIDLASSCDTICLFSTVLPWGCMAWHCLFQLCDHNLTWYIVLFVWARLAEIDLDWFSEFLSNHVRAIWLFLVWLGMAWYDGLVWLKLGWIEPKWLQKTKLSWQSWVHRVDDRCAINSEHGRPCPA